MRNSLKTEIYNLIKNQLFDGIENSKKSEIALNYVKALNLNLQPFGLNEKTAFFKAFLPLLKKPKFPLLKVNELIQLFNRWRYNPLIIKNIKFLLSKITNNELNENFWNQIILFCGTKKDKTIIHETKLLLIVRLINEKTLSSDQINNHPIFIQTLFNFQVKENEITWLKNEMNEQPTNKEKMMRYHILEMSSRNCDPIEICTMLHLNFSIPTGDLYNLNDAKPFFELMYKVLPPNYMAKLEYFYLGKLYELYRINSNLFIETDFKEIKDFNYNNIIDSIFKKFVVSGLFVKTFKNGLFKELERDWFVQVLNGKNIKDLDGLPVKLTRKAAHVFRCMPAIEMSITQGVVLSSLQFLVNDFNFAKRVVYSIRDLNHSNYWVEAMAECYKNGLRERDVTQVMDYLNQRVLLEGRTIHLKNKRIFNLMEEIRDWHDSLRLEKIKNEIVKFPKLDIKKFSYETTEANYEIMQILSPSELFLEGKTLNHCVYSYRRACEGKNCAIFSLRKINEETSEPIITLELRKNLIVQARGLYNRLPLTEELQIIESWANENELMYVA